MRILSSSSAALAALLFASVAAAGPGPGVRSSSNPSGATTPPAMPMGRSVGSPTEGHLIGGAHLDTSPQIRVVPVYTNADVRFGLGALVGLLDRASRRVHRQFPDAVMSVGHLSRQGGGEIDRHASHESGRDADVAFYVKNLTGHPVYADHFVKFIANGTAPTWPGAVFDDARNWALVAAVLDDPIAHVSHVFVASPLRARLLAYAAHIGAPAALQSRAAATMVQPHGGSLPHDDHFHIRISCPAGMTGCIEYPALRRVAHARTAPHPAARTAPPAAHAPPPAHAAPTPATHAAAPPPPPATEPKRPVDEDDALPASMMVPFDADGDDG